MGGIAVQAISPPAPWAVIAALLFSFAIRSIYMESCSMFVRGGVYVVVRHALGHFWASGEAEQHSGIDLKLFGFIPEP